MAKYKNWAVNKWKSSQCLKNKLQKTFRKSEELAEINKKTDKKVLLLWGTM